MARLLLPLLLLQMCGCALLPDVTHQPQFHNPFPQLTKVAVVPFANQTEEPTVNGRMVASHYRNELQKIPGFEVMPLGVVEARLAAWRQTNFDEAVDFQMLARMLEVDAVVIGAVTDFSEYYPPRMGVSVNWYAANPSFHPIPPGYGLPWGTSEEEYIPDPLVLQAEHALARKQLDTQTPPYPSPAPPHVLSDESAQPKANVPPSPEEKTMQTVLSEQSEIPEATPEYGELKTFELNSERPIAAAEGLPIDWPDPRGFTPAPPQAERPAPRPQPEPVLQHLRQYNGADADFTTALANYYYYRDEARFGGWQSYLQRKEDFIQFCCYLHITEMLAARGGAGETRVVWRWPLDRYEE